MVGRRFNDVFENDRLPPYLSKLLQKHESLTEQLEDVPQLPPVRKGSEVHSSPMEICNMLALALLALMHLRSYLNILMNVILKNNSPYL